MNLLFYGQSDGSKSKFSLECVGLVVLISSSICESNGSKSKKIPRTMLSYILFHTRGT